MPKRQYQRKKEYKKRNVSERFWEKVLIKNTDDCWIWQASSRVCDKYKYGQFSFDGYPEFAHRVAWILTNGPLKYGQIVCHKCDTPLCVNPNHLFVGSQKDNIQDMVSKERDASIGNRNPGSKLTEKDIPTIRNFKKIGISYNNIAKIYCVSRTTIQDVIKNRTWRHVA